MSGEFIDTQQAMEHWGEKGPCKHEDAKLLGKSYWIWCNECGAIKDSSRDSKWMLPKRIK